MSYQPGTEPTSTPEQWARAMALTDDREAAIRADVFNPNETDRQYYERRRRELEKREAEAPRNAN
jgi:hypothetical protein